MIDPASIVAHNNIVKLEYLLLIIGGIIVFRDFIGAIEMKGDDHISIELSPEEKLRIYNNVFSAVMFMLGAYLLLKWVWYGGI